MAPQTSLAAYEAARAELIASDRALRRDNARIASASDGEKRADEKIRALRAQEAQGVWDGENIPNVFPGMGFLVCKDIIDRTELFKIVRKMPKGALLHAHLDACVDKSKLLALAYEYPQMHIRIEHGVTPERMADQLPTLAPLAVSPFAAGSNAGMSAAQGYVGDTWIPLVEARKAFDTALGGPEGFDKWILDTQMVNPGEAYGTHNSIKEIWIKFIQTFGVTSGMFLYRPIFRRYMRQVLLDTIDDGISYVEFRINFHHKFMFGDDCEQNVPHREWIHDIETIVKEVKAEFDAAGRGDEFFGIKIIYTVVRLLLPQELEWYTADVLALKKEFPDIIAGFDLVGNENLLRPLKYYIPQLLNLKAAAEEAGLDLPLILHAGETLSDGGEPDDNMYDAILLGAKRIGHGYSLVKHPKLMEICRERGIAIEMCPISNEILRLCSSMPAHPLPVLLNNGIPLSLNSDDPAVFNSMGLSYDFYQVLVSSEISGLSTLAQLALDSLQYSVLPDEQKRQAIAAWERRFAKFV
ncbi:adenosine deaminase-like growth, partial [Peniophora sp. CONT]